MPGGSVGGAIVLGARESRVQGEGHQEGNTLPVESKRSLVKSKAMKPKSTADNEHAVTHGRNVGLWRAGCGESRTSGSAGGVWRRAV